MTGTFVVIIYERSFLLSRYQIKFYTSCLWIYVYIINLKVYYILVMHRECAKNLYILVPCFLCICFACQLELVFLVFQVAGESKGNDKYLCFPRHFWLIPFIFLWCCWLWWTALCKKHFLTYFLFNVDWKDLLRLL